MLRFDGYLTLVLLKKFHRLMKHGESLSARKANPTPETYSYKCAAGLKTLLLEYLLTQNRLLTGEERSAKTRKEVREVTGVLPLLTDLCLAMKSDPLGDLCLPASCDVRLPWRGSWRGNGSGDYVRRRGNEQRLQSRHYT